MLSIHVSFLILTDVFCFGFRLSSVESEKKNFHSPDEKPIERTNLIESQKKSLVSPLIEPGVVALPNCHDPRVESPSSPSHCQHVHIHFNGTRGETRRTRWKMPCLSIFLFIVIIVLGLSCYHNNYELSWSYVSPEEESPCEDEIITNLENCKALLP